MEKGACPEEFGQTPGETKIGTSRLNRHRSQTLLYFKLSTADRNADAM